MNWIIEKAKEIYKKYGSDNLDFLVTKLGAELLEIPLTKRIKEVYFHDLKTIVIDPNLHPYQKRHLICHALAHHLFHRKRKANYFIDGDKNFIEGIKVRKMEREAEAFVAYLLIPDKKLNAILKEEWIQNSGNPISELAEEFQVPENFVRKRLEFEKLFKFQTHKMDMEKKYRLATDGDGIEKFYWDEFIQDYFPSYERFWQKFVVPLTNRPKDIHFKTDAELQKVSKTAHDICLAQLHYSILRHLARVYQLLSQQNFNLDSLTEGMARICGALDVADELLERFKNPTKYDPWSEKDGRNARYEWRKDNNQLQNLRNYRNHLIHGRLTSSINGRLPKIGKEEDYFDWRKVTDSRTLTNNTLKDFTTPNKILLEAWEKTLDYLESNWRKIL